VDERGTSFDREGFNWLVKWTGKKAGLPFQVHAHMLRHAAGHTLANAGKDTRSIQAYLGRNDVRHTVRYTQTDVSSEKMIRINPHQRAFLATLAVSSRPSRRAFHFASAELVAQALDELRDWAEVNGSGDCRHCQPGEYHLPAWIPTDHHSTLWSNGRV
jgi:Phage integrase family